MCAATAAAGAVSVVAAASEGAGRNDGGGGVLTPASALGDVYVQRLNASGMQLTAETLDAASAGARPPLARGASYRPSEMKAI